MLKAVINILCSYLRNTENYFEKYKMSGLVFELIFNICLPLSKLLSSLSTLTLERS